MSVYKYVLFRYHWSNNNVIQYLDYVRRVVYVNWELINHVNLSICLSILLVSIIHVIKYNYGTGLCMCWYLHPIVYLDSIHSRNCKATKEVIIDMFSWLYKKWIDKSMDPYVRFFKLLYILYISIKQHIHHFLNTAFIFS